MLTCAMPPLYFLSVHIPMAESALFVVLPFWPPIIQHEQFQDLHFQIHHHHHTGAQPTPFLDRSMDISDICNYALLLLLPLTIYLIFAHTRKNQCRPKSLPVIGSTLELTSNFHRLYDWITEYTQYSPTFDLKYMSFRLLFTADPANVEHILKSKFHNYIKGPASHEIQYDLLGDGIFNTDGEPWKLQRKSASLEFASKTLRNFNTPTFRKHAQRLVSILVSLPKDSIIDLQYMLMRMTLDSICELGFGTEIGSLASDLPEIPFASAFDRSNAVIASRYFDPLWKIKKLLRIGSEARLVEDVRVVNAFTYSLIEAQRKALEKTGAGEGEGTNLLSRFLVMARENAGTYTDKMLRDAVLNFIIAGRDTTAVTLSWFFWLLTFHPRVIAKIVDELRELECSNGVNLDGIGNVEEKVRRFSELLTFDSLGKLQYLHAAISESLRLYPAVPLDGKTAVRDDVLPDGTKVRKGDVVNYVPYAMGRMKRLWGEDALEFIPERWIDANGAFIHHSPFKFTAFQAGPRICLGKDSAYLQMKTTAAMLIRFLRFERVADKVEYTLALTLLMRCPNNANLALPMLVVPASC